MTPAEMFDLVPLSSVSQETWKGRAVFHPGGGQEGFAPSGCQWVADEDTYPDDEEGNPQCVGDPCYDVGVVLRWEPDPNFADLGVVRVWFIGSMGSLLHYGSWNLWTPNITTTRMLP